jgi:hypothetical protein
MASAKKLLVLIWKKPGVRWGLTFLFFVTLYTAASLLPGIPEFVNHILLVLAAMMGVHFLERAFLWQEAINEVKSVLEAVLRAPDLWDDVTERNKQAFTKTLKDSQTLSSAAASCNLTGLYQSRVDIKDEIFDAIMNAKEKVWIEGITLCEDIRVEELLPWLSHKVSTNVDVKILLINGLRSPAAFRSFLRSSVESVERIVVGTDRNKPVYHEPFFTQQLYSEFAGACASLSGYPQLLSKVRFYAHNPACWMIVVDDKAYFQPYTFRFRPNHKNQVPNPTLTLPVLRFHKNSEKKQLTLRDSMPGSPICCDPGLQSSTKCGATA